jgi:hypothetical protein
MKAAQSPGTWKCFVAFAASDAGASPRGMEHRWGRRRPCRARVCITAGDNLAGDGQLRNVSMSGAFLETALPLALHAQIVVAVLRDGNHQALEFVATVVRLEQDGVGIEWQEAADGPVCRMLGCAAECAFSGDIHD